MRKSRIAALVAVPAILLGAAASAAPAMASPTIMPHVTGSFSLSGPPQYETINNVSPTGGSLSYTNFNQPDTAATGVWSLPTGSSIALDFSLSGADYPHQLVVDAIQPTSLSSFTFTGHGTFDLVSGYTWNATGSVNGNALSMHIVYTGTNAGYNADVTGTINPDGSITGSAADSMNQVLAMSAPVGSAFQALSYTAPVNSGAVIETSTGIAEFSSAIPAGHVMAGTPYTILVADHGSPGSVHDNYTQDGVNYPITSGNLVVH